MGRSLPALPTTQVKRRNPCCLAHRLVLVHSLPGNPSLHATPQVGCFRTYFPAQIDHSGAWATGKAQPPLAGGGPRQVIQAQRPSGGFGPGWFEVSPLGALGTNGYGCPTGLNGPSSARAPAPACVWASRQWTAGEPVGCDAGGEWP
ncbi:uncharacterized protein STAUR_8363 [Stigmatella aurantiaca DW4/3-1]|uniref:Uncharacterized protein n=1 Tax=Stigmatella aurantiaca (strain DW4/3-1) TaxID=378806 RepID=E3FXY8_STIAD|nr:uncharacterized protein STAUR_8363 [Stigmatella aurantiaca DW4/3-1]